MHAHAPGRSWSAVGIVAIGALHETLVHAMFEGHGKLRSHIGVAAIAEIGLQLGEKCLGGLSLVNGVTVCADDVALGVRRPPNVGAREILAVAGEAAIKNLLRLHNGVCMGDGRFSTASLHMLLARSVTTFAAGSLRRLLAGGDAPVMRILEKGGHDVRMAGLTDCASDVFGTGWVGWRG